MKLNAIIYNKLVLQAEEAQDRGMVKLADAIYEAIHPISKEDFDNNDTQLNEEEYSYNELQDDIYKDLWRVASRLMYYYGVNSVDVLKIDAAVSNWTNKTLNELENTLEVDEKVGGPLEPRLPGENK